MSELTENGLSPDATGGCRLESVRDTELTLGDPRLKALDLVQAPELARLRISKQATDSPLHLMLEATPALTRLELPHSSHGAILHLTGTDAIRELVIDGPVAQIDANWQSARFLMERDPHQSPWQRVRVVTPAQVEVLTPGQGLVIVVGQGDEQTNHLRLQEGDDWLVLGGERIQHVQISSPGRVCLQNMPALTTLNGNAGEATVEVTDAPRLKRVSGAGRHITLRQTGPASPSLTIADAWAEATLRCPQLEELHFPNAQALTLYDCHRLNSVELPLGVPTECHGSVPDSLLTSSRLFMDESTLKRHLEAVHQGDHNQVRTLLHVLSHRYKREEVVTALRSLQSLCEADVNPDSLWCARQELLARQLKLPRRKRSLELTRGEFARAAKRWEWRLPEDLAQEGLQADLAIWRYCRQHSEPARRYASVLGNQCRSLSHLAALVTNAMRPDAGPIDQQIMAGALHHTAETPLSRQLSASSEGRALARRLEWLIEADRINERTRKAVMELLITGLSVPRLVATFQRLLTHQPKEARTCAMRLAHASDQWIQLNFGMDTDPASIRSHFLQLALSPEPAPSPQEVQ